MTPLAPDLFERRFRDLMEIGRASLPPNAPEWTDHNAHDPGITLMELLAWVAEAQLYSLARRPRRDERTAYAALLGLVAGGTRPARGLIWPLRGPDSPAATFARSIVISKDAAVNIEGEEKPTFRPVRDLLFVPGRIERLETRLPGGRVVVHTIANERGGAAFLPFGETAGPRSVLAMTFRARDDDGLLGRSPGSAKRALWGIGIRAAAPIAGAAAEPQASPRRSCRSLDATLVADGRRFPVPIVWDSTSGLLSTGALLLSLEQVASSPREFTLELRSSGGFPRPPRWLRIEPNVIPVEQGRSIEGELHVATGLPDWSFELDAPGLQFEPGEEPVRIEIDEPGGLRTWSRCDRLADSGPDDRVFELDPNEARVVFGNDLNGRIPPAESQVLATYAVCDGDQGNVARNRRWTVSGVEGVYGVNADGVIGGAAPTTWIEQRREARERARREHALVSSDDLVEAARALPLLEVARAWIMPPRQDTARTNTVTLIAMRGRPEGDEPTDVPETRRWLGAVRSRLAGRMPLGTRLLVSAPKYIDILIRVTVIAESGRDPKAIEKAVRGALAKRLSLMERRPGLPLARREVAAWIRGVGGVGSVADLRLIRAATGTADDEIEVPRNGLPRLSQSSVEVRRS